jgi:hypothetical protein
LLRPPRPETTSTARLWAPIAAIFALWLTHVSAAYTAASLRCHDVTLGDPTGVRIAMAATTVAAAGALVPIALALRRRRASSDEVAQLAGFLGSVLGGLFAVYLLWSVVPLLAPEACR